MLDETILETRKAQHRRILEELVALGVLSKNNCGCLLCGWRGDYKQPIARVSALPLPPRQTKGGRPPDITVEPAVLTAMADASQPVTACHVATIVGRAPATVARTMKNLEERGLVQTTGTSRFGGILYELKKSSCDEIGSVA